MFHHGSLFSQDETHARASFWKRREKFRGSPGGTGPKRASLGAVAHGDSSKTPCQGHTRPSRAGRTEFSTAGCAGVLSLGWLGSLSCLVRHSKGAFLSGPSLGGQAPGARMLRSRGHCFEKCTEWASSYDFQAAKLRTLPSRVILTTAPMQRRNGTGLRSHQR